MIKSDVIVNSENYAHLTEARKKRFKQMIDAESGDSFAEMIKSDDGYCINLDRDSMLCKIYENRPKVCREFTEDRCEKIRVLDKC